MASVTSSPRPQTFTKCKWLVSPRESTAVSAAGEVKDVVWCREVALPDGLLRSHKRLAARESVQQSLGPAQRWQRLTARQLHPQAASS
jgi:hypothetical protein